MVKDTTECRTFYLFVQLNSTVLIIRQVDNFRVGKMIVINFSECTEKINLKVSFLSWASNFCLNNIANLERLSSLIDGNIGTIAVATTVAADFECTDVKDATRAYVADFPTIERMDFPAAIKVFRRLVVFFAATAEYGNQKK